MASEKYGWAPLKHYLRSNARPINNNTATTIMIYPMGRGFETTPAFSLRRTRPADHHCCVSLSILLLTPPTSAARTTPTTPNSTIAARALTFISPAYGQIEYMESAIGSHTRLRCHSRIQLRSQTDRARSVRHSPIFHPRRAAAPSRGCHRGCHDVNRCSWALERSTRRAAQRE